MIENEVLQRISQLCEQKHWSLYRLAKKANIPYSNLNNIFNRGTCPTIPTLEKICQGFGISLSEFFEYYTTPQIDSSLTEIEIDLVYSFRTLSKKDQELLQAYLCGLCHKSPAIKRKYKKKE